MFNECVWCLLFKGVEDYPYHQAATLLTDKPKGCLTEKLVNDTMGLSKKCFNNITLYHEGDASHPNEFEVGIS